MAEHPTDPAADSKPLPGPALSPRRPTQRFLIKTRAAGEPAGPPTDLQGHIADLVNSVKALSSRIGPGPEPEALKGEAEDYRSRHSRIAKKFHRAEERQRLTPPPGEAPAAASEAPTAAAELAEVPEARRPATAQRPRPRKPASFARQHPMLIWIAAQAFGFLLVAIGFALGLVASRPAPGASPAAKPAAATSEPIAKAPDPVSERGLAAVDTAMTELTKGDIAGAVKTYEEAEHNKVALPAVDYHLALLAVQQGRLAEAEVLLARAADNGEEPVAVCYLRAVFAGAKGNYREAAREFEMAAHLAPFDSKPFFYWGEALRRLGQTRAAIDKLKEAVDRPAPVADAQIYALKIRLAELEIGHATEVGSELAVKLHAANPAADVLVSAAADALQRSDFAGAGQYLSKAARQMSPAELGDWLADYFFTPYRTRKEIAPYLQAAIALARPQGPQTDPGEWTAAEGDPATWPSPPVQAPPPPPQVEGDSMIPPR